MLEAGPGGLSYVDRAERRLSTGRGDQTVQEQAHIQPVSGPSEGSLNRPHRGISR